MSFFNKIITNIIFILVMSTMLYSDILNKSNLTGDFQVNTVNIYENIKNTKHSNNVNSVRIVSVHSERFRLRYRYNIENISIKLTPVLFNYDTSDHKSIYNINTHMYCKKTEFFFKELYIKYRINKHQFGIGVLPFSDNSFIEYQNDIISDGEGLNTLVSANLKNIFYMYNINDFLMFKAGIGTIGNLNFIKTGAYYSENNKNSIIYWSVLDYRKDKFKLYNQYIYTKNKYKNLHISDSGNIGLGISYNDSLYSGFSIYDTIAVSYYKNNITNKLKESILKTNNLSDSIVDSYPNTFAFNKDTKYGWSNLIGIRKDFDFVYTSFIDINWFHTSDNWFSYNTGNQYDGLCNTTQNIRNNSFLFTVGVIPRKKWLLKLSYMQAEFNKAIKIGNTSEVTNDPIVNYIQFEQIINFKIIYKF